MSVVMCLVSFTSRLISKLWVVLCIKRTNCSISWREQGVSSVSVGVLARLFLREWSRSGPWMSPLTASSLRWVILSQETQFLLSIACNTIITLECLTMLSLFRWLWRFSCFLELILAVAVEPCLFLAIFLHNTEINVLLFCCRVYQRDSILWRPLMMLLCWRRRWGDHHFRLMIGRVQIHHSVLFCRGIDVHIRLWLSIDCPLRAIIEVTTEEFRTGFPWAKLSFLWRAKHRVLSIELSRDWTACSSAVILKHPASMCYFHHH